MENKPALSAVIPVHNEQGNVANLAREIHVVSESCNIQSIIFVDDNSSDETTKILQQLKSEIGILRILHHREQCGQTAAIFTGIKAADTPWVVTMDGDGQNCPDDIPAMVEALMNCNNEKVRIVNGNRNKKNNRKDTFMKRLSSKIANAVRSRLLNDSVPDSGCGLKLMHRDTYLMLPYFKNLHRFTPALFIRTGAEVISVDVGHRNRSSGVSHYGLFNRLWIGIVDLLGVTWLMKKGYHAQVDELD
jgi:dolichol-phosphate mannosyltransferase